MTDETATAEEPATDPWAELDAEAAADAQRSAVAAPAAGDQAGEGGEYPKDPQVEQAVHQLLTIGFGAFAPNWDVKQQEIDAAADAYARSLEDIFPGGAAALGPHFASLMMTLAIFGPRVAMKVPPQAPSEEQGEQESARGDHGEG